MTTANSNEQPYVGHMRLCGTGRRYRPESTCNFYPTLSHLNCSAVLVSWLAVGKTALEILKDKIFFSVQSPLHYCMVSASPRQDVVHLSVLGA